MFGLVRRFNENENFLFIFREISDEPFWDDTMIACEQAVVFGFHTTVSRFRFNFCASESRLASAPRFLADYKQNLKFSTLFLISLSTNHCLQGIIGTGFLRVHR